MLNNRYALTVSLDSNIEEHTLYEGYDTLVGRFVWVKFIKPTEYMSNTFISDFIDERTMIDSIECPYLLPVLDVSTVVIDGIKYMYIINEYSKGILLSDIISGNYMHMEGLVSIATQLVKALSTLYGNGMYHGSLNPTNILVDSSYNIKLLEVGTTVANNGKNIRDSVGKYYLSPAQIIINYTDYESDFYALGTVLFEAMFGKLPYDLDFEYDESALVKRIDRGVSWNTLTPYIMQSNSNLVLVVKRLLNRTNKYSSTDEILVDLSEILYANANIDVEEKEEINSDLRYLPTSNAKLLRG